MSNHFDLGVDWEIGSRDLESFARGEGWWRASGRLDVAAAYRNPNVPGRISEGRLRRSRELLRRAGGRHDVARLKRILRDHGEFGPAWQPGPTPEEERFFTLCAHSEPLHATTASLIAPLPRDRALPWPVWISFGAPCTSLFLPVYLDGVIPAVLARGGDAPAPDAAWWVFEELKQAASADFPRYTPLLRDGWAPLEEWIEGERMEVERRARAAATAGRRDDAAVLLTDCMARCVEEAIKTAEQLRARLR